MLALFYPSGVYVIKGCFPHYTSDGIYMKVDLLIKEIDN
jgi:hypothetical protein